METACDYTDEQGQGHYANPGMQSLKTKFAYKIDKEYPKT